MDPMDCFFNPRSVALVGASEKFAFGYGQTRTIVEYGFPDGFYLVNPRTPEVFGHPTWPDVAALPGPVDLAILIVPSGAVLRVMSDCAARGVRAAIVQSAGFAETGPEGAELQKQLTDIARAGNVRVIGPNCVGVINTANGFTTSETIPEALRPGTIGIIAQSGVFGNIMLDRGPEENLYFSKVATLGNRCDVDESDVLAYLGRDEQTRVITAYLEGIKDGPRFRAALEETVPKKPVIILKSGRTSAGRRATAGHTGSLSGEDAIYDGIFRQTGVLRARDPQDLFDQAKVLATQPLPKGDRIGMITTSGSLGALTADACVEFGLTPAKLSPHTVDTMRGLAPAWMNVGNPLDVGPSGMFSHGLRALMEDDQVDAVIAVFIMPWLIVREAEEHGLPLEALMGDLKSCRELVGKKPLVMTVMGRGEMKGLVRDMVGDDIPVLPSPASAVRAVKALVRRARFLQGPAR